jgi:inhibitor of cysteine peptidase
MAPEARPRRACLLLAATVAAAGLAAGAAPGSSVIRVGKGYNGKTVRLHPGDRLVVSLAANPSTGYSWHVLRLNRSLVKLTGTRFIPGGPTRPGSGGTYVLNFRAFAVGTTRLKLGYVRSGPTDPPARTYVLTLAVRR